MEKGIVDFENEKQALVLRGKSSLQLLRCVFLLYKCESENHQLLSTKACLIMLF